MEPEETPVSDLPDAIDKEAQEKEYSGRLLHQAAIYDNAELTQSLLEGSEKDHIDAQDSFGRTALYTAVTNNSFECGHLLLQAGANPSLACGPQCGCMTPLHAAALDNKHTFVSILVDYGADTNLKDSDGCTPYNLAEKNKNEGCCILLLERIARRQRQKEQLESDFQEVVLEGDVMKAKQIAEKIPQVDLSNFINRIPKGQNSLLFRACENGHLDMVEFLLTKGAIVQVHPVTGYSPLHAACHMGNTQCAKAILQHFPELIGAPTIDGTFPLHMACAEGKVGIVKLLLNFKYPDLVRKLSKESSGNRMYRLGVPINSKDGHGRTPLHVSTIHNRAEVVKLLLRFRVPVVLKYIEGNLQKVQDGDEDGNIEGAAEVHETESETISQISEEINPVEVDVLDLDGNSPLHVAVKGNGKVGYLRIASLLLQHKANPNKPFITPMGNCTPLMEACRMGNVDMMALLLRYGARDDNFQVLRVALRERNWDMVGAIIQHKSHMDPEYKVNIAALLQLYEDAGYDRQDFMTSSCMSGSFMTSSKCFRSMWPSHPVVINWHSLNLPQVEVDWLYKACWQHTLKPPPDVDIKITLASVTRLDLSNNHLKSLPSEVFQMPSLKTLNAAKNAIEDLIFEEDVATPTSDGPGYQVVLKDPSITALKVKPVLSRSVKPLKSAWTSSILEDVNFHSNRLRTIPEDVFKLPSLVKANFSENSIESLPFDMWSSPKLVELNLSKNCLSTLPMNQHSSAVGISIDKIQTHEGMPIASSFGSPGSSETGTPHRVSIMNSNVSDSLSFAKSSLPNPPSSLSLNSPNTTYPNSPDSLESPALPYQVLPVSYLNQWNDKIRIRSSLGQDASRQSVSDSQSKLNELNLSHNIFRIIPQGLACLAVNLDKLNVSYNKLTQIGPLENYPAGLKWLDLSHNEIMSEPLMDCEPTPEVEMYSYGSLSVKTCYNPAIQHKQIRSMNRTSTGARISRSPRPGSATSMSAAQGNSAAIYCPHRFHRQLDKLKTLRLSHNKLTKLLVTVQPGDELQSSGEEQSSTSAAKKDRLSDGGSIEEGRELLYPTLTLLDISYNCLISLTPDIRLLTQLSELKISANRLRELPSEMGLLKKLWNLDLTGCPAEKSLQALLGDKAKKTASVLSYLKSVKEEAMLYNRMKLMFVGIQGIGKTSLLGQLCREGRSFSNRNKNWAQRMGSSAIKDKDLKGENISTVGVDIGDLVLQKANREIIFSTWDFGGQREYYATHQYFLSKRSLYLVLWKLTDGIKGVQQILQWLVNIQARAPNSPVIIVGTHLDLITKKKYPPNYLPDLQRLLVAKYMNHTEPEKSGLPRVVSHIEISCKASFLFNNHVGDLVSLIWEAACEEQLPGNRGAKLLEQKVPATYVHLQEVVGLLAEERKREGKDPVLHAEQYKPLVIQKMEELYSTSFRDVTELSQATQFLHENGILLHYDDVNLQDIYFLDPQWLCDVLASVVTIREINSLAKSGIMRTVDLKILFKNAAFKPEDIKAYIIDLLSKFEVALRWDDDNLLIPSLLPSEVSMLHGMPGTNVRIPMQKPQCRVASSPSTASKSLDNVATSPISPTSPEPTTTPQTLTISSPTYDMSGQVNSPQTVQDVRITENQLRKHCQNKTPVGRSSHQSVISSHPNPAVAIVRLYLMSYFPSGFWPRLITRLLGDDSMHRIASNLYDFASVAEKCDNFSGLVEHFEPEWKCWQSGLELIYMGVTLLRIREVSREGPNIFCDYRQCSLVIKQDQDMDWHRLNLQNMSILEMIILNETVSVFCTRSDGCILGQNEGYGKKQLKKVDIQPSPQVVASLLAKLVDHVDTLLEDWYPDLGARFIQNARGMYLITRVVPCTRCLLLQIEIQAQELNNADSWSVVDVSPVDEKPGVRLDSQVTKPTNQSMVTPAPNKPKPIGRSMFLDGVGGTAVVHQEFLKSPDGAKSPQEQDQDRCPKGCGRRKPNASGLPKSNLIYCHLAEQCLQAAQMNKIVYCIDHANLGPYFIASASGRIMAAHVAPDSVFQDIGDHYLINEDSVVRGSFLGRGAFGAVYAGVMIDKENCSRIPVALKMLQPVKPDPENSTGSLDAMYKMEKQRWNKDPMKSACEAYLNARKELSILLSLNHPHIVPLLGITLHPLSLILSLAPLGALNVQLEEYVRAGARLPAWTVACIIKQVASALDYLHTCQIIYRDLKSENVLVWSLPPPHCGNTYSDVLVKLADYGVSRCVIQSGTKGLAGTPPFIAPEIIQHNGEETYTEKVDIFSFGMFMYELLVLKLPFDGEGSAAAGGANMKGHILSGGRPHLTDKDINYPTHFLDLMIMCWSHDPSDRPSANQIVCLSETAEFSHLYNVIPLDEGVEVLCGCSAPYQQSLSPFLTPQEEYLTFENTFGSRSDVWLATRSHEFMEGSLMILTYEGPDCLGTKRIPLGATMICCMCVTEDCLWAADSAAVIHVFRLGDYTPILKFPATTRPNVTVTCMAYGETERQVYVVLDNGRFILCEVEFPMDLSINYSPVKTECPGNGKPIHCICALTTESRSSELWCGQSSGRISVWNLHSTQGNMRRLSHGVKESSSQDVTLMALCPGDCASVWTYVQPGTVVYHWNAVSKLKDATCDVRGVLENIDSGAVTSQQCQVTAITVLQDYLYIGTASGRIIITDKLKMAALTIMSNHGNQPTIVKSIIPLLVDEQEESEQDISIETDTDSGSIEVKPIVCPNNDGFVLSVNVGYNDLMGIGGKNWKLDRDKNSMYLMCWASCNWE